MKIKILGREFTNYQDAVRFLRLSIKMEKSEKIRQQLEHKLKYLEVELELAKEKALDKKHRRKE